MASNANFDIVFQALRAILQPYVPKLPLVNGKEAYQKLFK